VSIVDTLRDCSLSQVDTVVRDSQFRPLARSDTCPLCRIAQDVILTVGGEIVVALPDESSAIEGTGLILNRLRTALCKQGSRFRIEW
jgi:hypothetical protein